MEFIDKELYENEIGIYKIVQKSTGVCYIGQTSERFVRRFWHNDYLLRKDAHQSPKLQEAFNETGGSDFEFVVIELVSDSSLLNAREIYHIEKARNSCGAFNITSGGGGRPGVPMSESAKQKLGAANRIHMTGKKLSDETRAKMRASSKHHSPSPEHIRALSEYMSNRNISDETKDKIRQANIGSKSPSAKIDESIALNIKRDIMAGLSLYDVADKNNASYGIISAIVSNRTWKHVEADGWDTFVSNRKTSKFTLHDNPVPSRESGRCNDH